MAAPLGIVPEIEEDRMRVIFKARSDLWLSPYEDKETPIRIYEGQLRLPASLFDSWMGSLSLTSETVSLGRTDLLIGKRSTSLSSNLQSQSIGFGLERKMENKSSISFYGALTSASDEPFKNGRDIWTEATTSYRSPMWGLWQGIFALNYSKNRGFLNDQALPLVGAAYKWSSNLNFIVGFPFARVTWNSLNWTITATATPVGGSLYIDYIYSDSLLILMSAGVSSRSYLHVNRTEDKYRLIFEEKYAEVGLKRILSPKTLIGFKAGASFDRSVYEAITVFHPESSKSHITGDLTSGIFLEFLP